MYPHRSRSLAATLATVFAIGAATAGPAVAASDPMLYDQWSLSDPAIGVPEAWTQSRGDGVIVAVLDSGVQLDHPDLAGNLWTNPGEIPGNGVDDDRNGVVDDIHGANIITGGGDVNDDEGHGTHVAGVIAAQAGNDVGVSGVAPNARIMAVKVLDAARRGDSALLANGIRYAVDKGAQILNVSLNGDATTPDLDDALRYAAERGATVVASSGNNDRDLDLSPSFPAASAISSVLCVTATTAEHKLLGIANTGQTSVDIAAPGSMILSTARGAGYELRSGTSMAAPHVSGALALMAAVRPELSQADLRGALLATTSKPAGLAGLLSTGELNVAAAMHQVLPGNRWRVAPAVPTASTPSAAARARLKLNTSSSVRTGRRAVLRWSATGAAGVTQWRVLLDGRTVAKLGATRSRVLRKRIDRSGQHRWKVVGYDAGGQRVVSAGRGFRALRRR